MRTTNPKKSAPTETTLWSRTRQPSVFLRIPRCFLSLANYCQLHPRYWSSLSTKSARLRIRFSSCRPKAKTTPNSKRSTANPYNVFWRAAWTATSIESSFWISCKNYATRTSWVWTSSKTWSTRSSASLWRIFAPCTTGTLVGTTPTWRKSNFNSPT